MGTKWEALVRAVRTFVQGAVAAGAIAAWEAGWTATQGGTFNPRLVVMAAVTAFAGAVVTFAWNHVAPKLRLSGSPSGEALARAGRTLAQAVVAVGLVAAWDSVYATVAGGNYNPRDIAAGAVTALVMSVVAYLHTLIQPASPEALRHSRIR